MDSQPLENFSGDANLKSAVRPTTKDGRLYFNSYADFKSYYDYLDVNLYQMDDIEGLVGLQRDFGFVSLISETWKEFLAEGEEEYVSQVNDLVMEAILNTHHEVGVGTDVIVFQNRDDILVIPDHETGVINDVRGTPKGEEYSPTPNDPVIVTDFIFLEKDLHEKVLCVARIDHLHREGSCEERRVELDGKSRLGFAAYGGTLKVDWGDGTPLQIHSVSGSWSEDHQYAVHGTYTVRAWLSTCTATDYYEGEISTQGTCVAERPHQDVMWTQGQVRIRGWEEVRKWWGDWVHRARIKGRRPYSGGWKSTRSKLDIVIREYKMNNCNQTGEVRTDSDGCSWCRERTVTRALANHSHKTGDLFADFRMEKPEGTLERTHELVYPCD